MIKLLLDLPALERLIGGDSEIEVSLREGVVQSFTKRHLKAVATSKAMQPYLNKVCMAINRELKKSIPVILQKNGTYILDPTSKFGVNLMQAIHNSAHDAAMDIINTKIGSVWKGIQEKALARIEEAQRCLWMDIESEIVDQITTKFEAKVQKEIVRRIKAVAEAGERVANDCT